MGEPVDDEGLGFCRIRIVRSFRVECLAIQLLSH